MRRCLNYGLPSGARSIIIGNLIASSLKHSDCVSYTAHVEDFYQDLQMLLPCKTAFYLSVGSCHCWIYCAFERFCANFGNYKHYRLLVVTTMTNTVLVSGSHTTYSIVFKPTPNFSIYLRGNNLTVFYK